MPFNGISDPKLPPKVQEASENKRRAFVSTFNSSFESCMKDGGDKDECESSAFAIGFSAMDKVKEKGAFERILNWAFNKDSDIPDKELAVKSTAPVSNNSLLLWKSRDGVLNWLATYSNNIRDNDRPVQEIIAAESHINFEKKVDAGEWPLPEAWHWHEPLWKWGEATMVATDVKESGEVFAIAGGYVIPGAEFMAEALAETGDVHAVSHGMPQDDIARDEKDNSIIVQHRTAEISSLPSDKAANPFTFITTKEKDMITDEKRAEAAATLGVTDEQLSQLEAMNASAAGKATEEGRDTKETSPAPVDNSEIKTLSEMLTGLAKAVEDGFKALSEQNATMKAEIDTLKANAQKDKAEMSPAASIYQRAMSAIGAPETKVDGRTTLAKQSPGMSVDDYVQANLPSNGTGISFLDKIKQANIQKVQGGSINYER